MLSLKNSNYLLILKLSSQFRPRSSDPQPQVSISIVASANCENIEEITRQNDQTTDVTPLFSPREWAEYCHQGENSARSRADVHQRRKSHSKLRGQLSSDDS